MNAQTFWGRFKENIYGNKELVEYWDYTKEFTGLIINKLAEKVIAEEDVITEKEYFRVDLISYKNNMSKKKLYNSLQKYSWDLVCAVEHENDHRLWVDEVVKLAHLACPLRVVIGYLPKKVKKNTEIYLEKVAETLDEIEAWNITSNYGEYMIVLGDCQVEDAKSEGCIYTPYIYNKETKKFEKMNEA